VFQCFVVSDFRPGPTIQLGINTLREMAMRCPLALDEQTVKLVSQFKVRFFFFFFLFFPFFSEKEEEQNSLLREIAQRKNFFRRCSSLIDFFFFFLFFEPWQRRGK
jgi:hypothetical protein